MSPHLKRFVSHRFLLAISLVLTMIAFSFMLAQPPKADASSKAGASACPQQTVEITYYTDETMTVVCGRASLTCYCNETHSGCQTPYSTERYLDCW